MNHTKLEINTKVGSLEEKNLFQMFEMLINHTSYVPLPIHR
jgi:hypothetical protein